MKMKAISVAVAASVAAGGAVLAQADHMYLNDEGLGEVLLFPFYDAENGNATNFHIVNTTDEVKAVKVRFLEYKNSQEVLDFNLYLSAEDHFAFGVIMDPNGTGGAIITSDNSCTVPALGSPNNGFDGTTTENADGSITRIQPFTTFDFINRDDVDQDPERTLRGHVEIIEMGSVNNMGAADAGLAYAAYATHGPTGVPLSCGALATAWATDSWVDDAVNTPSGGLYGIGYHISVEDAAAWGFEADAIDNWADPLAGDSYHSNPGDLFPSIVDGQLEAANYTSDGVIYTFYPNGRDSISSLFMHDTIANDVMINPAIGGETDWVTTFPTKRYYVDVLTNALAPEAPFDDPYVGNSGAPNFVELRSCEVVGIETWDREEAFIAPDNGFSPSPGAVAQVVCDEQNTTAWGPAGTPSALNVERDLFNLGFSWDEGWARWSFTADTMQLCNTGQECYLGLPVTGFAAYAYANGSMGGTLMNYGHVSDHKTTTATSGIETD